MKSVSIITLGLVLSFSLTLLGCSKSNTNAPGTQQKPLASTPENVPTPATPSATPVTYQTHIKQIMEARCVSCHSAQGRAAKLPLDTYNNVLKTVQPNNPENSKLIQSVDGGSMSGKASGSEVDIFKQWVKEGAKQ